MRTSSANNRRPSDLGREAGFSLVELLATLAIMSLMLGAVVVNLPARPSAEDVQTQALVEALQAQLDAAALAGEMRALRLDADGLTLMHDRGAVLTPVLERAWPDGARVRAENGDAAIDLDTDTPPLFWIEPYGEVPPLRLTVRGRDDAFALSFDDRGRVVREALR